MATRYLEEMLYKFLSRSLTDPEKKVLFSGWDAEKHIDEETEEELKEQIYSYVKSNLGWASILARLRNEVQEDSEDDASEDDASEEESSEED